MIRDQIKSAPTNWPQMIAQLLLRISAVTLIAL